MGEELVVEGLVEIRAAITHTVSVHSQATLQLDLHHMDWKNPILKGDKSGLKVCYKVWGNIPVFACEVLAAV